ncbi:MAG: winged helix-turn-helix domain-containing protein, partial [Dokdonella sp.]
MRYRFGTIELRVPERELLDSDQILAIEPMVFDLLAYLVEHRDRAVGRDELIAAVWGRLDVADGALAQAILRLRKTLDLSSMSADPVRTVPRHGYRWVAETHAVPTGDSVAVPPQIEIDDGADPSLAPAPARRRRKGWLAAWSVTLLAVIVAGALVYRLGADSAQRPAESPLRIAILPVATVDAADETRLTGVSELLRREITTQFPATQVIATAEVAAQLDANPQLRDSGDIALLEGLHATRLLGVALHRDGDEIVLRGDMRAATGLISHAEIRDGNLEAALPRLIDALFQKPGAAESEPIKPAASPPDTLAQARRLGERGQTRDAYAQLIALHRERPSRDDILVALATTECALELMAACETHLDAALASTTIEADAKVSAHLLRADRHLEKNELDHAAREIDAAAAAMGDSADNQWQARILLARQHLAVERDQVLQARDFARRSLTLFRLADDARGQAAAQLALGDLAADSGNFDECVASYTTAADTYEDSGDLGGLARASAKSALALAHLGRFNDARTAARRAYESAMRQQDPVATRSALYSLGWSLLQSGQLNDARETAHRSLAMIDADNNPQQAMRLNSLLGFIDAAGGRFRTAMTAWDAALVMAHGDQFTVNGLRLAIVYAALNAGDEKRARIEANLLRQDAGKAAGDSAGYFADHANALLAAHRGDLDAAARLYAEVWQRARRSGTINQQLLADYSDVLFKRGDLDTVESLLGEASLPDQEGHLVQLVRARYLLRRGQTDAAQAAFELAV